MAYDPGQLRHPVRILRRTGVTKDKNGVAHATWEQDPDPMWCRVTDVSGRDFYAASAVNAEDVVTFLARWGYSLGAEDQLLFEGRRYAIIETNHLGYARDFVQYKTRWIGQKAQREAEHGIV